MKARLIDTSRWDGFEIDVDEPPRLKLELPAADGFLLEEESVKAGNAYRGPNTVFHYRIAEGGESVYVADHLVNLYDVHRRNTP